ncbi:MAG: NAD-dependent epimerase/dehydratase family protein [Deltaproteobacteria bacterium]|nr:NAD-dependent epimerase/dehydratase family protein [Deltaproteobacteria bacterium]
MKIVVTGGAGFIGSHIVDAYIAEGHEVVVIDDFSSGSKHNLNRQTTLYSMDILDSALPDLLSEISPDILSLHAAQMELRRSVADPLFDARVNILGLIHLLEGCKGLKIKRVIFASSGGAVYGEQERFPAPEDHPTRPMSPYGVSKLAGEHYLAYYQKAFGIPYIALRYGNVYGPRQSATGEAGVVAIFIRQLLQGRSPTINGDGKQTRDYVYVGDVVAANLLALASSYTGALNIGTGCETDVVTLFDLLRARIGPEIAAVHGPPKPGEQTRSSLDTSRAREALGWSPRISLSAGLDQTVAYYRQPIRHPGHRAGPAQG